MQDKYLYEHSGPRYVHREIAKQVLGHEIPRNVEIHHVDGNGKNNNHDNLVICENKSYHMLLHNRSNGLRACGNVHARLCYGCKQWKDKSEFQKKWKNRDIVELCKECASTKAKEKRGKNKDKLKIQRAASYQRRKDKIRAYYLANEERIKAKRRERTLRQRSIAA
jgi:hypothetical protein